VQGWRQVFMEIAIDEMMHLAVVNNLLVSLGAAPHFDRPNFPHDCAYYMPDLFIDLQPFNEETMRHFIAVEQPTGSSEPFPHTAAEFQRIEGMLENRIGADPHDLDSQGDLYNLIATGLRQLCLRLGEDKTFIGPAPRPAFKDFMTSSGWRPITDLRSALHAIAQIVEQGEGASGDNPDSHYWKFRRILAAHLDLKTQDPEFAPAYPVLANPFGRTPPEAQGKVNLVDNDLAVHVGDLFNEVYGSLLLVLGRFFAPSEETEEEAQTLCNISMELMKDALLPLGDFLVQLPAGPQNPDHHAGPSFVLRTVHTLPYKHAAWQLIQERLGELSNHALLLSKQEGTGELAAVHDALDRAIREMGAAEAHA
jgi:hypothetical protein